MCQEWMVDELMVCYMFHEIAERDFVVQGMGTPLVFSAFLLAKAMHAPNVQFMYTVGNTISQHAGKLSLTKVEDNTIDNAMRCVSMSQMHLEIVPSLYAKEFMRPAQIDGYGNANTVVIGDYARPKVRLPGSAGVGDVSSFNYNIYFYVTRHDTKTLVEKLDFCSSVGYGEREGRLAEMGQRRRGPRKLITDKCVFDFSKGRAELVSLHPGVSLDDVLQNTGFCFPMPEKVSQTAVPTKEELHFLRERIDPLKLRKLEFLTGNKRLEHIKQILANEKGQK